MLEALVSRLSKPDGVGALPPDWETTKARFGFPPGYLQLIEGLGVGFIGGRDVLLLLAPGAPGFACMLTHIADQEVNRDEVAELREAGESPPFGYYPEPGGLLPWAFDCRNGTTIHWLSGESGHDWACAVEYARSGVEDVIPLGIGTLPFLMSVIDGSSEVLTADAVFSPIDT